jgi:hypothetical protein
MRNGLARLILRLRGLSDAKLGLTKAGLGLTKTGLLGRELLTEQDSRGRQYSHNDLYAPHLHPCPALQWQSADQSLSI